MSNRLPAIEISFFRNLEAGISRALSQSANPVWEPFWCEGIVPNYSELEWKGEIETEAWMGEGTPKGHYGRQHRFVLRIQFAGEALRALRAGEPLVQFIPGLPAEEWMELDLEGKKMVVRLGNAKQVMG